MILINLFGQLSYRLLVLPESIWYAEQSMGLLLSYLVISTSSTLITPIWIFVMRSGLKWYWYWFSEYLLSYCDRLILTLANLQTSCKSVGCLNTSSTHLKLIIAIIHYHKLKVDLHHVYFSNFSRRYGEADPEPEDNRCSETRRSGDPG